LPHLRALGLAGGHQFRDPGKLLGGVDRPDVGVLVQRVTQAQRAQPTLEAFDHLVVDRFLDQQAGSSAADVALVEVDAVDDALDGLVDRGVVEDDVGGLATQFQGQALAGTRQRAADVATHLGGAGERDLVHVRVGDQRRTGATRAGDDVDHARGQVGLLADLGEQQGGQRRGLRRLEHDRVAARQGRRDLPCQHQQREVPRDHLPGHAQRLRVGPVARPGQLVGPAGVVEEVRGDQRDVDVAGLPDRLAVVQRLQDGELAGPLLDDPGDPVQVLAAVRTGELLPRRERLARGRHGAVDVLVGCLGDLGQDLFGRWADRLEGGVGGGVHELAADEQPVAGGDVDDGAGLGRGGVVPRRCDQVGDGRANNVGHRQSRVKWSGPL
jgi:hypothetical protein